MEPSIIGSWSKRTARALAHSSSDDENRPQKRSKKYRGPASGPSGTIEEDEHDKKYTSDLLSIRDAVEQLQATERNFHRSQQTQYEQLKRTILDMESRWTRSQYKRQMANVKQQKRELEETISRQNEQLRDDLVASSARQGRETLTPAASRVLVSSLPTPGETVRRPSRGRRPPAPDHHRRHHHRPDEDLMMELFEQDLTIQVPKSEDDSDRDRDRGRTTKQPFRHFLAVPKPEFRQRGTPDTTPAELNSSDGDDEDNVADDSVSVRAEQTPPPPPPPTSDYGGIIWPAGVGIGPEEEGAEDEDEMDIKDEHPRVADTPELVVSPSTVCAAERGVPVCPGPFRMSPSSQLWLPSAGGGRLVRGREHVRYGARGDLEPGDGRGVEKDEDGIYRPEALEKSSNMATTAAATAAAAITVSTSKPSATAKSKKIIKQHLNQSLSTPSLRVPSDASPRKRQENPQQLINNGRLIAPSEDSDDEDIDIDMDVDVDVVDTPVQSLTNSGPSTTREALQALGVPPPAPNIPELMQRFSRAHIQKAFGGKPRGTVTVVRPGVAAGRFFPVDQFLCINEKLNPYYPPHAGAHGAMFIFRTGVVPLNTEWAVFCSRRRVGTGPQETFEYAGHYVVRDASDLSYDEWMAMSVKFKEGWASHVAHQAKSPRGWASQNLASRRLVRSADGVTTEHVRGWFDAAAGAHLQHARLGRDQHARLGRRVLEFLEYKSGVYNSLVRVKAQIG